MTGPQEKFHFHVQVYLKVLFEDLFDATHM